MSSSSSSRNLAREPLLPLHAPSRQDGSKSASSSSAPVTITAQAPTPVAITIRFASSLPDLTLTIKSPYSTNISTLKRLIRSARPSETSKRRLRLIYGGKVLADKNNIGQALGVAKLPKTTAKPKPVVKEKKPVPPPPKKGQAASWKGKEPVRLEDEQEKEQEEEDEITGAVGSVYVHCSIGDELTNEELAEEAETESQAVHHPSTLPAPQGFDRLLNAGFTESDIAALRSQFHGTLLSNTPSTNNSGQPLSLLDEESRRQALALEERWIDESATTNTNAETDNTNTSESGGLEDTLIGVLWGFFWPLCIMWMLREEGVLGNSKRQLAVIAGLLMNCVFGLLKLGSAS